MDIAAVALVGAPLELAKIAQDTAELLVSSASTDLWSWIKDQAARVLSRGKQQQMAEFQSRLDDLHDEVATLASADTPGTDDRLALIWQGRIITVLEAHPEAAAELREIIAAEPLGDARQSANITISDVRAGGNATQIVVGKGEVRLATEASAARGLPRPDPDGDERGRV